MRALICKKVLFLLFFATFGFLFDRIFSFDRSEALRVVEVEKRQESLGEVLTMHLHNLIVRVKDDPAHLVPEDV